MRIDKYGQSGHFDCMKIRNVGTLEAKTRLSALLNEVQHGKSFYITKHGKPIAELRPVSESSRTLRAGFAKGTFLDFAEDFDAPLEDFREYLE